MRDATALFVKTVLGSFAVLLIMAAGDVREARELAAGQPSRDAAIASMARQVDELRAARLAREAAPMPPKQF